MNDQKKKLIELHFDDQILNKTIDKNIFGYKEINFFMQRPYLFVEKNIIKNLKNKLKILDYCCGDGLYSILPATLGHQVYGMDISSVSISKANERAESQKISNNTFFETMDAEKLTYKDDYFDLILSYGSLSYLKLNSAYNELNRVLKPNGKLVVIDSLGHNLLLNLNRKKNLSNWGGEYSGSLETLKLRDVKLGNLYLNLKYIKFFDLFTVIGLLVYNKFNLSLNREILFSLDKLILSIPYLRLLAMKYVAVYEAKK